MDVTPQVINEVEFHSKMRGYDPDEVDDFLERVAAAVGGLHDRLRESMERATAAERRAAELEARLRELASRPQESPPMPVAAPDYESETETISRTLVLAQRTADAAIAEARSEAERLLGEARDHGQRLVAEAEAEARRTGEDTRNRVREELAALEADREAMRADVAALERFLQQQRQHVRAAVNDLQRVLDDPSRLREAAMPAMTGPEPTAAAPAPSPAGGPAPEPARPAASPPAPAPAPAPSADPMAALDDPEEELFAPLPEIPGAQPRVERPITGGVTFSPPPEEATPPPPSNGATSPSATRSRQPADMDAGPPTAAYSIDDDAYLAELRKAALSDTSAGLYDDDFLGTGRPRARFGRRR